MGYIVKSLDLNNIPPEQRAEIDKRIADAGGEIQAIAQLATELLDTLTKGHEKTLQGLRDKATYRAFVGSLTAEDLRSEDITEECIADFLQLPIEEKLETIDLLDIFTVYRLYERKEAENAFTAPSPSTDTKTATGGYKGLEGTIQALKEQLLKQSTATAPESLQGVKPIKGELLGSGEALGQNHSGADNITINIELVE